jgi:adenylate cyclase class IV
MAHYEIEIKSLLGTKERADEVKERMKTLDGETALTSSNSQLNHYFEGGNIQDLYMATANLFTPENQEKFKKIITLGKDFSVRTRERNQEVLLVVKASVDEGTSQNTISRLEFEEGVDLTLAELDTLVLAAGYTYQAKWSREREEYQYKGITVCFDKNAGYGYVAEFEKILPNEDVVDAARTELTMLMSELDVAELSQERLARMFAYYNAHWADYYGTDKIFVIE